MTNQFAAMRIDLTEARQMLREGQKRIDIDPQEALAWAALGHLAYTIAAAGAGMRAVDVIRDAADDRR